MTTSKNENTDALHFAFERGREMVSPGQSFGYGFIEKFDGDGKRSLLVPFWNTITDNGDLYNAQQVMAGVPPVSSSGAAVKISGMQIGTGVTAVNKAATTGVSIGTYLIGQAFDASYPQTANLGVNLGVNVVYKTTYAAGVGTSSAITEAAIGLGTVTTGFTVGNTVSRTTFTAINKGASDTLAITWNHKFLGT